jgi:hypothetical protein
MIDFNIAIKVDAGSSKTSIDGVHDALAKTETAADRTSKALTGGMKDSEAAAENAKRSLEGVLGRFGEFGKVLGEVVGHGTIAAAGLIGLGAEVIHLSDEFTKMENAARRLHDPTRSLGEVMQQQVDLAGKLHASYEQAAELTNVVRERTEDLNLTDAQRMRLTEALGMAADIEGKSVSDAANAYARLGFALDEGLPAGKALKQIFIEFPPIQKAMEESLHMTGGEIIAMGNASKMGAEQVARSLYESKSIIEEHAKVGTTWSQSWSHAVDSVKVSVHNAFDDIEHNFLVMIGAIKLHSMTFQQEWALFQKGVTQGTVLAQEEWLMESIDRVNHGFIDGVTNAVVKLKNTGIQGFWDPWASTLNGVNRSLEHTKTLLEEMKDLMPGAGADLSWTLPTAFVKSSPVDSVASQWTRSAETIGAAAERMGSVADALTSGGKEGAPSAWGGSVRGLGAAGEALQPGDLAGWNDSMTSNFDSVMSSYEKRVAKTSELVHASLRPVATMLVDAARTGEISWQKAGESIVASISEMIVKELELKAAAAITNALIEKPDTSGWGTASSGLGDAAAALLGGGSSGGSFDIPHAAHGFAGIVKHQSGEDTHLAMFHVKAGEHVQIRTPEQQQAAQQGGHTVVQPVVRVTNVVDQRRDLMDAMHGPDGLQAITNHIGKNPGTFRALLGVR